MFFGSSYFGQAWFGPAQFGTGGTPVITPPQLSGINYMGNTYATDTLIELLKNLEAIPTNQNTFTNADFVKLMNYCLQNDIQPLLLKTNEEYFVHYRDYEVTQNTTYLTIPPDAIGMRCRDVVWVSQNNDRFVTLPRISPEARGANMIPFSGMFNGSPGYVLEQNRVVFWPKNNGPGTVRIYYFRRPNILTLVENSGTIVSIDTGANTVTLDVAPDEDTWDTGVYLDAIHSYQPFDFAQEQMQIVDRVGLTFEFDDVSNLSVGDVFTLTGYSIFTQYIPIEAQGVLVQGTAMKCLQSLGDNDGFKLAKVEYEKIKKDLVDMVTPRVQGQTKKIGSTGKGLNGAYSQGWGFGNGL